MRGINLSLPLAGARTEGVEEADPGAGSLGLAMEVGVQAQQFDVGGEGVIGLFPV